MNKDYLAKPVSPFTEAKLEAYLARAGEPFKVALMANLPLCRRICEPLSKRLMS